MHNRNFAAFLYMREQKIRRRRECKIKRMLRDASDPFRIDDFAFATLYRLPKYLAFKLINDLRVTMVEGTTTRRIPHYLKVLSALRFYATGGYQSAIAQEYFHPMDQTAISNIIKEVTNAIYLMKNQFIHFPSTTEQREKTERK